MKVLFFDLKRLYRMTEHEIDREIRHVLESGHYILGKACQTFEEQLKESLVGGEEGYAIGCNSGTDALVLPLLALGVGPGDEVITVAHTAIPTITAIRSTGGTPVFCDIHPKTWVLDVNLVTSLLTPKTKAIVAVHLYGNMVDIPELKNILKKAGRTDVRIIEDCAQAQGSTWDSRQAGTQADFGAFSFYPTKNVGALGDAGAVFTRSREWADKIKRLRFYGQQDRYNALDDRGVNSRLDELQAAILSVRLRYLKKWGEKKEQMTRKLVDGLEGLPLDFQAVASDCHPNWHLLVAKLNAPHIKRDDLLKLLDEKGVQCLIHYPLPTHLQKAFAPFKRSLPVTEDLAQKIFSIPMNPTLLPEEIDFTIATLRSQLG